MTISPDARLGRYEVRAKIGEGGMGEVYLARDTNSIAPSQSKFCRNDWHPIHNGSRPRRNIRRSSDFGRKK